LDLNQRPLFKLEESPYYFIQILLLKKNKVWLWVSNLKNKLFV